jgi:hypothetical protein
VVELLAYFDEYVPPNNRCMSSMNLPSKILEHMADMGISDTETKL